MFPEGGTLKKRSTSALRTSLPSLMGFPGDTQVKNLPAMQKAQEMQVQSLSLEDPLHPFPTPYSGQMRCGLAVLSNAFISGDSVSSVSVPTVRSVL